VSDEEIVVIAPKHYVEAKRHNTDTTDDQKRAQTISAAQAHAVLAFAAATAVSAEGLDRHAWTDVAATKLSTS
jgi:hypothetical protein